jgi:hypothetical protein
MPASTIAAVNALRELNRSGRRDVPADAPMPFRKEWRALVKEGGDKPDRHLWETAVLAHLRNKWRSGDVWIERSANYRRFDSYLLPPAQVAPIAAGLKLPATADEWLADRGRELDRRLKRFAHRLGRGEIEGVSFENGKLSISPVRADESAAAKQLAARIDSLMPRVRITELLHEVARSTGFAPTARVRARRIASRANASRAGGTIGKLMCGPLAVAIPHQAMAQPGSSSAASLKQWIASSWLKAKSQPRPWSNQRCASIDVVVIDREREPRSASSPPRAPGTVQAETAERRRIVERNVRRRWKRDMGVGGVAGATLREAKWRSRRIGEDALRCQSQVCRACRRRSRECDVPPARPADPARGERAVRLVTGPDRSAAEARP